MEGFWALKQFCSCCNHSLLIVMPEEQEEMLLKLTKLELGPRGGSPCKLTPAGPVAVCRADYLLWLIH